MLFSSTVFIFLFLPLFFLIYFTAKKRRTRNTILLIFSLIFYAWGEPVYIFLMIFSITFNYIGAILIENNPAKAKLILIADVILNLFLLVIFKYTGFLTGIVNSIAGSTVISIPEIALPIGISFYTFQIMSYIIDVYRKEVSAQRDILFLGAYLSGFPQLIAGPVVRYRTIADELVNRAETADEFAAGMKRFVSGLAKKVLIANTMALAADNILAFSAADYGLVGAWIAMIAYSLQIYFDFSGYSDMAIGLGRMMGFHYLENFNYPYIAVSVTDFWRRWHISMSTFFRDYVYIPLGGNRVTTGKWIFNMAVVWACTGLWHGADWTFILWGLYFGLILIIEKLFIGKYLGELPVIRNVYSLFLIIMGWVIFRAESLTQMFEIFKAMFGVYGKGGADVPLAAILQQSECGVVFYITLIIGIIISMPISKMLKERFAGFRYGKLIADICVILILGICVIELALGSYNPFIYFDF